MSAELLIILALVLVNGVFAGAEIAVISLRRTRLAELVERQRRGARSVQRLREQPERFLATVQVGISVVSAAAAAFGGATIAEKLAPTLARVPALAERAESLSLGIVVVGVSFLSIVLGELVPKSLALRQAEGYALLIARPMLGLAWVARPVVWLLTATSNLVLRVFGDRTSFTETRLSREELVQMMDEAATAGAVDIDVGRIATRVLEFDERVVSDVMVPREGIRSLPLRTSADTLFELGATGTYARYPVWEGEPDNYVGVVQLREAEAAGRGGGEVDLEPLLHLIPFLPEDMPAPEALRTLQRNRVHLAIVVDEHGDTRGLVTVEDLIEELVGEIMGEDEAPEPLFWREPDGTLLVDGATPVYAVNRELELSLPEGEAYSTIAGLCLNLAGRIPQPGDTFRTGTGVQVEVVEATPRRVRKVRLIEVSEGEEDGAAEEGGEP